MKIALLYWGWQDDTFYDDHHKARSDCQFFLPLESSAILPVGTTIDLEHERENEDGAALDFVVEKLCYHPRTQSLNLLVASETNELTSEELLQYLQKNWMTHDQYENWLKAT